jgi:hypothetical protein
MQHVTAEGTALVKLAEDAASNKKVFALTFFSSLFFFTILFEKVHFPLIYHWTNWRTNIILSFPGQGIGTPFHVGTKRNTYFTKK